MRFLTWANKLDERSELLFASAKHFGIDVEPIGLGRDYRGGVSKIEWLRDWLAEYRGNEIIVCTDAFDCLYLRGPQGIAEMFQSLDCETVYAGEKWYRKRPPGTQAYFDWRAKWLRPASSVLYRYPNCGAVIGFVSNLRWVLSLVPDFENGQLGEQWHMTSAIATAGYHFAAIDYDCNLFWCCAGQWRQVPRLAQIENDRLTNRKTGGQPYVLHSPIPNRSRALLTDIARNLGVPV